MNKKTFYGVCIVGTLRKTRAAKSDAESLETARQVVLQKLRCYVISQPMSEWTL